MIIKQPQFKPDVSVQNQTVGVSMGLIPTSSCMSNTDVLDVVFNCAVLSIIDSQSPGGRLFMV